MGQSEVLLVTKTINITGISSQQTELGRWRVVLLSWRKLRMVVDWRLILIFLKKCGHSSEVNNKLFREKALAAIAHRRVTRRVGTTVSLPYPSLPTRFPFFFSTVVQSVPVSSHQLSTIIATKLWKLLLLGAAISPAPAKQKHTYGEQKSYWGVKCTASWGSSNIVTHLIINLSISLQQNMLAWGYRTVVRNLLLIVR